MKPTEKNGDADLAMAMMLELGDPPDDMCLRCDENGELLHMPQYMQENRAKRAAWEAQAAREAADDNRDAT